MYSRVGESFSVSFSRVQFSVLDEDNTVSAAAAAAAANFGELVLGRMGSYDSEKRRIL